ncbi:MULTISPECIES: alcohol dehydrogenase catalytic domain-containing protein [unclassified Halomonas]|uniref:alcohol dehydrogenase catalytic domain-containing protein n=1 Tax=unclassified Halomonas TaxID=2609666 RepID=UPI001C9532C2|nr:MULTISPECIES: alcohol dehydrogenase catalytic domain-containing protein [unclassified Halomonas]MBY5924348.1 alcohol dehydrogenase catalytic domain-containing protein [Halomonas sp. DP4Y7-2]MBY6231390.1 alcohol dehydrogenase catalytic domain-containing protein [Halomonas sp. DP4Y7-1]
MQALFYTGHERMALQQAEPQPLAPGESRVQVEATGICGSDLHAYHGHDPRRVPPMILGHEAAGRVVEGAWKGRRVTMNPLIVCGHCRYCRSGRQNLCENRSMIGMTRPGSFAESVTIADSSLIELPATLSAEVAAMTEPVATALHGIHRLERVLDRPLAESSVLVIGAGAIGLITALVLRGRGVRSLRIADLNPLRRETAERAGLEALDPLSAAPGENSVEAVFDCVGAGPTRQMAVACTRPGGAIMHLGLQDNAGVTDTRATTLKELSFLGAYTYSLEDLHAAVALLDASALGELSWVEHRSLSEGGDAFHALANGRTGAAKIILHP